MNRRGTPRESPRVSLGGFGEKGLECAVDTERASRPGRVLLWWGLGLAIAATFALAIVLWFVIDYLNHAF